MLHRPVALPSPDTLAVAHSERLLALIREEIAQHGPISFAQYMTQALYTPGLGYYSAGADKLGSQGDFITAPEISPLFSRSLAHQCQQVLQALNQGDILELGAGTGVMAADILTELEALHCLPEHYYILETSADLKQRQQQLLQARLPHLFDRITWLNSLEQFNLRGILLANEVLDALPVHKFKVTDGEIKEFFVATAQQKLIWHLDQSEPALIKQIQPLNLPEDYESEINLQLRAWLNTLQTVLTQGLLLFIDYGFPRHEYYHPDRNRGTLHCHYRHHAHDDPLILTGLQDITAHVDFTAVAEAGIHYGLTLAGYTTQAYFLFGCGIMQLAENTLTDNPIVIAQQIKKLTLPSEMGELFKVIGFSRELDLPFIGFNWYDMRSKLIQD